MVRDSLITNNAKAGIYIEAAPAPSMDCVVMGTTPGHEPHHSLLAKGWALRSWCPPVADAAQPDGLEAVDGASVISYGDNIIRKRHGPDVDDPAELTGSLWDGAPPPAGRDVRPAARPLTPARAGLAGREG